MIQEFTTDIQRLFLRMMLTDAVLYTRVINIMNPKNFDRTMRPVAEFIVEHADKYSTLPEPSQILAVTGEELDLIPDMTEGHGDWFLDQFESFSKRQELERAILKAADLMEKGEFDPVEKLIKDAVQISLMRDMGTNYFDDPKGRLNKYFNSGGQVSTGWPQLDHLMMGGMNRGELHIFAGSSGSGKSLVMMNLALNWLSQGLNGCYITLELSEELTSLRTDAMLTDMSTRDIRKDLDTVELKVKMSGKKFGKYQVKNMPAQSSVNQIRAYVKEMQIQLGTSIDFLMVDYLDLVMPSTVKVDPSDVFTKDKYVSEELRNLAKELGVLFVTASQLGRSAVDEVEFDHSHIAGGISKINSSDYVFGIFTSRSMRERGKYQMQCMKSRSSTGVGKKIDLDYNVDTMRITDSGGDEDGNAPVKTSSQILSQIKSTSQIGIPTEIDNDPFTPKITGDVQSAKLKQLLAGLKKGP